MNEDDELDEDTILELLEAMHAGEVPEPNEGLRERKKRRSRQRISNVATAMFLTRGFDNVTVAQIASSCEVSEQTVYNYFPTKESMLLDRSEALTNAVADAVRDPSSVPLVDVVLKALDAGIHHGGPQGGPQPGADEALQLRLFRRFTNVATGSPALAAARLADFARFTDQVSVALADRVSIDPGGPEVLLATLIVAGLTQVRLQSTYQHVQHATSLAALDAAVRDDLERAARLAGPTLAAFDQLGAAAPVSARETPRPRRRPRPADTGQR